MPRESSVSIAGRVASNGAIGREDWETWKSHLRMGFLDLQHSPVDPSSSTSDLPDTLSSLRESTMDVVSLVDANTGDAEEEMQEFEECLRAVTRNREYVCLCLPLCTVRVSHASPLSISLL